MLPQPTEGGARGLYLTPLAETSIGLASAPPFTQTDPSTHRGTYLQAEEGDMQHAVVPEETQETSTSGQLTAKQFVFQKLLAGGGAPFPLTFTHTREDPHFQALRP